jgi:hypothetical protein
MSVLLTVNDAAGELQVPPIAVRRLIALGLLKAAIAGVDTRISPTALLTYVDQGAQNLKLPELDGGADDPRAWLKFEGADMDAGVFEAKIRDMLAASLPNDVPAGAQASTANLTPTTELPIQPTPEMLALAKETPSRGPFGSLLKPILYTTRIDWFAVSRLSAILAKLSNDMTRPAQGLAMLYRSQADFQRITEAAWAEFQGRKFKTVKVYSDQPAKPGVSRSLSNGRTYTVEFGLPYSNLGANQAVLALML